MTFTDNRGILVEAHDGGNITYVAGTYYWIGVLYNKYVPGGRSAANNSYLVPRIASGVQMYSSTDLRNWTYVGNILPIPAVLSSAPATRRVHIPAAPTCYIAPGIILTSSGRSSPRRISVRGISLQLLRHLARLAHGLGRPRRSILMASVSSRRNCSPTRMATITSSTPMVARTGWSSASSRPRIA